MQLPCIDIFTHFTDRSLREERPHLNSLSWAVFCSTLWDAKHKNQTVTEGKMVVFPLPKPIAQSRYQILILLSKIVGQFLQILGLNANETVGSRFSAIGEAEER